MGGSGAAGLARGRYDVPAQPVEGAIAEPLVDGFAHRARLERHGGRAASEGGAGTPVPALSIEVDDLEAVLARVRLAGIEIVHGPVDEAWGVRRFFIRDPGGRLLNVLQHANG